MLISLRFHLLKKEGVAQHFLGSDALLGVQQQHPPQQVHGLRVHSLVAGGVEAEVAFSVALVHFLGGSPLEDGSLHEQDVEDEAQGEDVAGRGQSVPLLAADDLRRHVPGGPAAVEDVVLSVHVHGQAQVGDHRVEPGGSSQHDVFGLDVAVHDAVLVHFEEALGHAPHEGFDFFLAESGHSLVYS
jgi:hypothetical protein